MAAPATILEAIDQNAKGPASVTVGNETVTVKDIDQLITADRYTKTVAAANNGYSGLRRFQMRPGGTG